MEGLGADRLGTAEARDHVEMVERILAESSQRLCAGGEFFLVWGLYSAAATLIWQLVNNGTWPRGFLWLQPVLLVPAVVFSIVRARGKNAYPARFSLLQREYFNVLWLTIGMAFVVDVAAFNIFRGWAAAAIWTFAEAIVLFFIGLHGNRYAQLGGIVMLASLIAANFVSPMICGFVLAAGMIAGYAGFGLAEMFTRDQRDG
jgi:hypothetical protein